MPQISGKRDCSFHVVVGEIALSATGLKPLASEPYPAGPDASCLMTNAFQLAIEPSKPPVGATLDGPPARPYSSALRAISSAQLKWMQ
jgi:hypothetical protein